VDSLLRLISLKVVKVAGVRQALMVKTVVMVVMETQANRVVTVR